MCASVFVWVSVQRSCDMWKGLVPEHSCRERFGSRKGYFLQTLFVYFSPTHNLISLLKYHIFVIIFNSHVYWKYSNAVGKKIWPEYWAARSGFLNWPLWLLNVPSVQLSGQPCEMELSVFCPGSSCGLRAEQLQPRTAHFLAWLIVTLRTKELLGSTVIIHSLHSRGPQNQSYQNSLYDVHWTTDHCFVVLVWSSAFWPCKANLIIALEMQDGSTVSMQCS